MAESFLKMLGRHAQADPGTGKFYGAYTAIVDNIEHDQPKAETEEEKGYRLKVRYPWLNDKDVSYWARVATMMAGKDRGAFFMPDVDEEVLVVFEGGDFRFPIIIGYLWNGKDKYPQKLIITPENEEIPIPIVDQPKAKTNNYRFWHSREKHIILFRDEPGKLQIVIRTNKSNEIVLDDTDGKEKIQIYDKDNDNYIQLDTVNKKITIESKTGEIYIKAKTTITLECKDLLTISKATTKMKAGSTYKTHSGAAMEHKSDATMDLKAGGTLTEKAPLIKLN
jgi:uncharacterized protein involved in type VI secretion and phage assembly